MIVLVEPYYGGSHRVWADNWIAHSRHDISLLTLPDEFWRWRLRGGAVTMAEQFLNHVGEQGDPDAVVVSSLVDVASLAGLARRALADIPVALYMHESQLLYPLAPTQRADSAAALTNWRSLLAADVVWFNSSFHRDALRAALPTLLAAQPTPRHDHLIDTAFDNTSVLWPGVDTAALIEARRTDRQVPRVLWNQRWDHDKNPAAVFSALVDLADQDVEFTVALAGANSRPANPEFAWVFDRLFDRIDHTGYLDDVDYRELLLASDVVVSAADHEFFGIAVVEAIAAGAVPVLPARLSFPELIASRWHEAALYGEGDLTIRLQRVLTDLGAARAQLVGLRESMRRFDVTAAAAAHDQAVDVLLGAHSPR